MPLPPQPPMPPPRVFEPAPVDFEAQLDRRVHALRSELQANSKRNGGQAEKRGSYLDPNERWELDDEEELEIGILYEDIQPPAGEHPLTWWGVNCDYIEIEQGQ